jgi:hypothetical protein
MSLKNKLCFVIKMYKANKGEQALTCIVTVYYLLYVYMFTSQYAPMDLNIESKKQQLKVDTLQCKVPTSHKMGHYK